MNQTFTLNQLTEFTLREKQLLTALFFLPETRVEHEQPPEKVVDFLLNYSKVLSVRKSKRFGVFRMVLN